MMLNKDEIEGVAKATAEIVKAVPIYEDAMQPVAREVGKSLQTLGGVINVALAPLAAMVYGYEVIKTELKNRLEIRLAKVSPENIVSPSLQVVGPLLEKYKFVHDNEDLSQMFVNLLANSMDKDKVQKAHPSFVNVISELSPDEAKLIRTIRDEPLLPKLDITLKTNNEGKEGHLLLKANFTLLGQKANLQHAGLTPSYLSNLQRLMIIQCSSGSLQDSYLKEDVYKQLEEDKEVQEWKRRSTEENKVETVRGVIHITDFGKMFMEAVL